MGVYIEEVGTMIFTYAITVDNLHQVDFFCDEVGDEAW
jgi:hypothetical protein